MPLLMITLLSKFLIYILENKKIIPGLSEGFILHMAYKVNCQLISINPKILSNYIYSESSSDIRFHQFKLNHFSLIGS